MFLSALAKPLIEQKLSQIPHFNTNEMYSLRFVKSSRLGQSC
jgi:hypothetical protein